MRSTTVAHLNMIQMDFSGAPPRYLPSSLKVSFLAKPYNNDNNQLSSSVKFVHKVDSEGNHLRGNFGYCGSDCSEDDDGEEFDKEVSFN